MTDPKTSGIYKATVNGSSIFARFDTFYGWATYIEPTSWRPVRMELTISKHIEFIKY